MTSARFSTMQTILACLCGGLMALMLCGLPQGALAEETRKPAFPLQAERILFLGDSITHSGHYIYQIEARLRMRGAESLPEFLNVGLSSETCTGLSEPGHPFPRPNVQDRLIKALELTKPDVVVACYGMNDGIYHPFNEERFRQYQQGLQRIVRESRARGARVVLLTPPPFDPLGPGKQNKLRPADADEHAYFAMYENYDNVLKQYGEWILQQPKLADMVVDVHAPLSRYTTQQRLSNPDFTLAPDGIHPNAEGHRILAETILAAWGVPGTEQPDAELLKLVTQRGSLLHDAWLSHIGHKRPDVKPGLPIEEAQTQAAELLQKIEQRTATLRENDSE